MIELILYGIIGYTIYYFLVVKKELKKDGFNNMSEKTSSMCEDLVKSFEYQRKEIIEEYNLKNDIFEEEYLNIKNKTCKNYTDYIALSLMINDATEHLEQYVEFQKFKEELNEEFGITIDEKTNNRSAADIKQKTVSLPKKQPMKNEYRKCIQSIENSNFEKVRKYNENLLKENEADSMQEYFANQGRSKKAIVNIALEQFIYQLEKSTITLVDWGCNQGIAVSVVLDYIKQKQLDIIVDQVYLVDDDTKAISRAVAHIEALKQNDIDIQTIQKDELDKLKGIKNNITLNIIANDTMPIDILEIDFDLLNKAYFMCVSDSDKEFVDSMYEDISNFNSAQDLSIVDGKIGKFRRYERVFKI